MTVGDMMLDHSCDAGGDSQGVYCEYYETWFGGLQIKIRKIGKTKCENAGKRAAQELQLPFFLVKKAT